MKSNKKIMKIFNINPILNARLKEWGECVGMSQIEVKDDKDLLPVGSKYQGDQDEPFE